ncbi:MAG: geranylgeranyl reductase family protein [Promethearchaeota archaeon]
MVESKYDVVIVGAGPAGLLASEIIAKRGFTVAVVEKDQIPGKTKPCGGFLTSEGVSIAEIPVELAERRTSGLSLSIPGHPLRHINYPQPIGIQITREALGRFLCQRTQSSGAQIFLQHQMISCFREDSGWRLILRGKIKELHSSILIGADGVNSTVARETGFRHRFNKDQLGITVQAHITLSEAQISSRFGSRMELYYGREICPYGYLWIFPKRNSVYVGVGSLLSAVHDRLEPYLHNFIRNHPIGKRQLAGGTIQRVERALVPLTYERRSTADGVLLAGDAAGHCSAITGEGIHYAFMAGKIAGEVSTEAIANGDTSACFLRKYEKQWTHTFGSDLKWGLRLRNLFYRGMTSQNVSSGITANKRFLQLAADLIVGVRPYRNTILRALPHYLWQRMKSIGFRS